MASLINVAGLTINPDESRDISKLIIERELVNSELSEIHEIELGITHKMQIAFAGRMVDSLKKAVGCVPNTGSGVTMSEKFWDPAIFDSRWEHCAADLNGLLKLFQKAQKINPDFYDRIDSQEMGVIYSLVEAMMRDTIPVKVWFSNKAAIAGDFKAGTDLALYNVIDGLFKQIFAEITVASSNYVAITQNAGASYAAQVLPVDAALDYLTKVVNARDSRLAEDPNAIILATRSIVDNYRNTLRTKTIGAGFLEVLENGKTQLYFDGIKVVTMYVWDRNIKGLLDNGIKLDKPHRIVLTTPSNIPVGTTSVDDFETLTSFYDQYRKSNVLDVAFSLDAKHLESYMTVAAY